MTSTGARSLAALPKAHLHLHLTGGMRRATLLELADEAGLRLPLALRSPERTDFDAVDRRGWFRFQRLYDIARSVLRRDEHLRRLVRETVEDEAAEGSRWLELQVDPSGYAARFGGITRVLELLLDAAREAADGTGVGVGLVVAANRTRSELDARTLARLAARYADRGVVGFGLSNDERSGAAEEFARAFAIARRAGLASLPHGGELAGAASVRACLDVLHADRIGHGVAAASDASLLARLAAEGVALEVCPTSNVALGVADTLADVPLRAVRAAGVPVALGADDPLLFGSRLVAQYAAAREVHGIDDAGLAALARDSVRASRAPSDLRCALLAGVDAWLASPPEVGRPVRPPDRT